MANLNYPGRLIKQGEQDKAIVKAVQKRLNETGCGLLDEDGDFGTKTANAVKLFQARFSALDGTALIIDGKIGSITWAVLFGSDKVRVTEKTSDLLAEVIKIAESQIGVRETKRNQGPEVNVFLKSVGLDAAKGDFAWCAAFVYWCFKTASEKLGKENPAVKKAGVINMWNTAASAGITRLLSADAVSNPSKIKPGFVFVIGNSNGTGHTGIVERVEAGKLITIEGNTNEVGSREGIGVFRHSHRKINSINKGFIDYSKF